MQRVGRRLQLVAVGLLFLGLAALSLFLAYRQIRRDRQMGVLATLRYAMDEPACCGWTWGTTSISLC